MVKIMFSIEKCQRLTCIIGVLHGLFENKTFHNFFQSKTSSFFPRIKTACFLPSKMDDNFLPDLKEKKRKEDIDFDIKVKVAQEKFEKTLTGYLNWLKSPEMFRKYPTWAKNNKNSFRARVKRYSYDHAKDVMYRVMQNNDKIGMYINLSDIFGVFFFNSFTSEEAKHEKNCLIIYIYFF